MKYIKLFDNKNNLPQVGEYAIVEPNSSRTGLSQSWRDFLKCHVGKIINKKYHTYRIEFKLDQSDEPFSEWVFTETLNFRAEEIIQHSIDRKDLEYIEDANKYNL